MPCYGVFVEWDEREENQRLVRSIRRVHLPDLGFELRPELLQGLERHHLSALLRREVEVFLEFHKANFSFNRAWLSPKAIAAYSAEENTANHELIPLTLDFALDLGCCERVLPRFGILSFIAAELFSIIVTITALELAAGSKQSRGDQAWNIILAIMTNFLGMVMYLKSGSSRTLERVGRFVDGLLSRNKQQVVVVAPPPLKGALRTAKIMSYLGLNALLLAATIGGANTYYQGLNALGEKAQAEGSLIPAFLYAVSKWMLVILGGANGLSFMGGYLDTLMTEDLMPFWERCFGEGVGPQELELQGVRVYQDLPEEDTPTPSP